MLFVEPADQARMSSRTAASSDAVGSSATTSDGRQTIAWAIRDPLALTAAQFVRVGVVDALRVVGQADLVHRGERPLAVSRRSHRVWARTTSPICEPTVRTGFRASADSWKTMPISRAADARRGCAGERARDRGRQRQSRPTPMASAGSRPSSARATVVLPEPDGPDTPTISRASIANETASSTPRVLVAIRVTDGEVIDG